ncbi:MAG: ABC transporter ATP-binding protein [Spirochaetia bacterium]|nr:ABC transporter ATP-binding protein [Spirochaetia bacterium]
MKEKYLLKLSGIVKDFGDNRVIDDVSFSVKSNEFLTILGPSGCGKTTLLRAIGGFEEPTAGKIFLNGEDMAGIPPHKRQVNTVFQKYALFPHLNVFDNVAFGLKLKKVPKDEIRKRVKAMLKLVDLKGFEKRNITKLSGGQQQRVAIARALINHPKILLLDEPLGALDLKLRKDMQIELKQIQQNLGIAFVYVTHDQEEALSMSDTVVVMKDGKIAQMGTPQDIYNEPVNAFVADFIGENNIFDGEMVEDQQVEILGAVLPYNDGVWPKGRPVDAVIRPEDVKVVAPENGYWCGRVESVVFKGVHYEIVVNCGGYQWLIHSTAAPKVGEEIGMTIDLYDLHLMKKMFDGAENRVPAEIETATSVLIDGLSLEIPETDREKGEKVVLRIPPSAIDVVGDEESPLTGTLLSVIYKGKYNEMIVDCGGRRWLIQEDRDEQVGIRVGLKIDFSRAVTESAEAGGDDPS